jgi:K+-sensing histidine kinase KdpD
MLQLLRDMLEIPTISPKRIKLDRHTTDVGLLVEHAVAANRPLAVSSKVCLEVRLQRPLPSLSADAVKLTHALAGLLSSAIRSCHAGSSLELVAGANAGHVVLTLRHETTGEPDDVLGSLFHHPNPTRQRRRLADERASLNVGYLKRVVEAHHGTLEFKADRKQESAVILTLPVAKGKSAAVQKTREGSGAN